MFFDFERAVFLFFTEYIAIMGLFIFLAHYASKICAVIFRVRRTEQIGGRTYSWCLRNGNLYDIDGLFNLTSLEAGFGCFRMLWILRLFFHCFHDRLMIDIAEI